MQLMIINRGGGIDTTDVNAGKDQILTGYSAYVNELKVVGAMPNRGAISYSLPANGTYTIPLGFHNGSGRVYQSLTTQGGSTVTPGTNNKLAVPAGRYTTGAVYAAGDTNLAAGNIKENVDIFGVKGYFVGVNCRDANAGPAHILSGYTGYVNQAKVTGTMTNRGSIGTQWLSANGSYTVAAGWHNGQGVVKQNLTTQGGSTVTPGTNNKLAVPAGRYTTGAVYAAGDTNLAAGNIKENVDIFGVKGSFVGTNCRDANAGAAQILSGYTGYVNQSKVTGTMTNRGAISQSIAANGSYTVPYGWHNGSGKVTQSLTTQGGSTVTPGTSNKLAVASGRYTTGAVYVAGDSNLAAGNIKKNVYIFGVRGSFVGTNCQDANAGAAQILSGYTGYVNQAKVTGTMTNRGAVNGSISANSSWVVEAGWHNGQGKITQSLTTQDGKTVTPGTSGFRACDGGRWVTGNIWLAGNENLVPWNIKNGVTIFGVTGTFTG